MKEIVDGVLIESTVKALVETFIESSKELFKELEDEVVFLFGREMKKFVARQKEYYGVSKTLLHGNSPVKLEEYYFPLSLKRKTSIAQKINTSKIENVMKNINFITIAGDAGSGKSTLMKYLFLNCIESSFGVPIFFELRYLNDSEFEIEEILKKQIYKSNISDNERIIERLLTGGKFIFFLDGYDEIKVGLRQRNIARLNDFIKKYRKNKYVITTRPNTSIFSLNLFENFIVKPLDNDEISKFINKQLAKESELANKIIQSIQEGESRYISSFLTNPLLLSLYILTFRKNPSIPEKRHIFYRRVIQTLYSEHDSISKLGYVREKRSKLSQEEFEAVLKRFSVISYFGNKFSFDRDYVNEKLSIIESKLIGISFTHEYIIEDLRETSLWVEDFGTISFSHRSIQEYLAALYIKGLYVDQKKDALKKIKQIIHTRDRVEIENLLLLLKDMDNDGYTRFLYIPILEEIESQIFTKKVTTKSEITLNVLRLLCYNVKVIKTTLVSSPHPYFAIPDFKEAKVIDSLIQLTDRFFLEISDTPNWSVNLEFLYDKDIEQKPLAGTDVLVNIDQNIPEIIKTKFIGSQDFVKFSNEFGQNIRTQLNLSKKLLELNQTNEIDIIDLL